MHPAPASTAPVDAAHGPHAAPDHLRQPASRRWDAVPGARLDADRPLPEAVGVTTIRPTSARTVAPDGNQLVGTLIGDYRVLRYLAYGGMGDIYVALDPLRQREVVIKLHRGAEAASEEEQLRFQREIRLHTQVRSPHVTRVYDSGWHQGVAYLVMEHVAGLNLAHLIIDRHHAGRHLSLVTVLSYAQQIAAGLRDIHRAGILHCDIKPANVLVGASGQLKLTDFGVAKALGEEPITEAHIVMGTRGYMSPELMEQRQNDEGTDLYAFGLLLLELTTSMTCVHRTSRGIACDPLYTFTRDNIRAWRPDVPLELCDVLMRCLNLDEPRRYRRCDALVADLAAVRRALVPRGPRRGLHRDGRFLARWQLAVVVAAIIGLVLLAVLRAW